MACACAVAWWLASAYGSTLEAREALEGSASVAVTEIGDDAVAFSPAEPAAGLVFYPGAKVEAEAYAPLMQAFAEKGFLAILVRAPLNFALLDADAADSLRACFPEIGRWYLAGHSLGGVAAASCAAGNPEAYAGLLLLASYPADDLRGFDGPVLSVYGTADDVLDRSAYADARSLLPPGAAEIALAGGNHACFGAYGPQDGDGAASIFCQEQRARTAQALAEMADASGRAAAGVE